MSNPDNSLDDLILTDPAPEKGKSKSLLLLLALVILLIIVGAILAKMIFSDSDSVVDNKEEKVKKVEVATNIDKKQDKLDTNISNDLAPLNDDADLAPLDDEGKNVTANAETVNVDETKNKENKINEKDDLTENTTAKNLGVAPVSNSKIKKEKEIEIKPDEDVVVNPKPKATYKKSVNHTIKPKPKKHTYGGVGNVYIQVGSFTKGPESSFIRKIRNAGFKYRIKTSNGYRRVYVGPFRSRQEAANVLGIVRAKISPNAFIK